MTNDEIRIACATERGCPRLWSTALPKKVIHCDVPKYTEDVNAAFTLVEHLQDNWSVEMRNERDGAWTCCFYKALPPERRLGSMVHPSEEREHSAPTLPLAICGAFLKTRSKYEQ